MRYTRAISRRIHRRVRLWKWRNFRATSRLRSTPSRFTRARKAGKKAQLVPATGPALLWRWGRFLRLIFGLGGWHIAVDAVLLLRVIQVDIDGLGCLVNVEVLTEGLVAIGNHLHSDFPLRYGRKACRAL